MKITNGMAKNGQGTCILCGESKTGAPVAADWIILAVRKARAFLKMPAKPAVACETCLGECKKKRLAFEKQRKNYSYGAAVFLLILIGGSAAYGKFDLMLAIPALLGTAFILCLPYAKYFPDFRFPNEKTALKV